MAPLFSMKARHGLFSFLGVSRARWEATPRSHTAGGGGIWLLWRILMLSGRPFPPQSVWESGRNKEEVHVIIHLVTVYRGGFRSSSIPFPDCTRLKATM